MCFYYITYNGSTLHNKNTQIYKYNLLRLFSVACMSLPAGLTYYWITS